MRSSIFLAGLALAGATGANAASIVNGSFESGIAPGGFTTVGAGDSTSITGWTVTSGSVDYIGSYWQAQDGSRSIDLAGSANGSIAQDVATQVGQAYKVTFWIGRNPDGGINPRTGFVSAGGTATPFTFTGVGSTRGNMLWEQKTFNFVATGTTTTLSFASDPATSGSFYGPALDNVSIAGVPEPAVWSMFIIGFGLTGAAMRRARPRRVALRFA